MKLITNDEILKLSVDWKKLGKVIDETNFSISSGDYSKPIKPYLDFNKSGDRIIAMPARIGGTINSSGIKWIASFPDNKRNGKTRVNSTTILNDVATGETQAIVNSKHLSSIRAVTVSYLMIKKYIESRKRGTFNFGVIGLGPIGRLHIDMIKTMFPHTINCLYVFDKNKELYEKDDNKLKSLDEIVKNSDILITCTDVSFPYIEERPKSGGLVCNISLRDFKNFDKKQTKPVIIVDDWEEVSRKGTNIESLNKNGIIKETEVYFFRKILYSDLPSLPQESYYFFNPMGIALYDIAITEFYVNNYFAKKNDIRWE